MDMMRRFRLGAAAAAMTFALPWLNASLAPAQAAEDARSFWLLGLKATSMAAVVPPPGTYGSSFKYFYVGDGGGNVGQEVVLGALGNLSATADVNVDATVALEILSGLWVAPGKLLDGNVAFGLLVPFGYMDISADIDARATLTLNNGTTLQRGRQFDVNDDTFNYGDLIPYAQIGWNRGHWHWSVTGLLAVPVGAYDKKNLANIGLNRWVFDVGPAVTWMDPTRGHEISINTGFTFNGNNSATDYKTGTEFHIEWALVQHFSKRFSLGLAGYHYQQLTGDSGAGATLGPFKGRVTALGPNINYNFQLGPLPVATSVRWLHEFNVKNRLKGDTVVMSATIPLGGPRH